MSYKRALQAYRGSAHGQGSGPIWLDDLACSGSESSVHECRHRGWGKNDCAHKRDASVKCTYGSAVVRLAGGSHNYGRVDIYDRGRWDTVCDHTWDIVVCRELGFTGATSTLRGAGYGRGSGPILRQHMFCQGNEASLLDCPWCPGNECSHSNTVQ